MSQKKARREEQAAEARWILKKRRISLALYLAFLLAAAVGTQGPWYLVYDRGQTPEEGAKSLERAAVYSGDSYGKYSWEASDDPAEPRTQVENALRPSVLALLGCLVAFFFASYDLVADANVQVPILLATLLVAGCSAYVVYDIFAKGAVIRDFIVLAETKRFREAADSGRDGVAPVSTATAPPSIADRLTLRFQWGLALFASSSLVMLLDSLYMTFFAQRTSAENT